MPGGLGPGKGKDFDTGNVIGPCIVTADELDPNDCTMVARVNGEEWSRGHSGTIHWTFEDPIAHVSQSETLYVRSRNLSRSATNAGAYTGLTWGGLGQCGKWGLVLGKIFVGQETG